jgi:hypothetical protein
VRHWRWLLNRTSGDAIPFCHATTPISFYSVVVYFFRPIYSWFFHSHDSTVRTLWLGSIPSTVSPNPEQDHMYSIRFDSLLFTSLWQCLVQICICRI